MDDHPIEKGIPIPDARKGKRTGHYRFLRDKLFELMNAEVGDSVLFDFNKSHDVSRTICTSFGGVKASGFTMRQVPGGVS